MTGNTRTAPDGGLLPTQAQRDWIVHELERLRVLRGEAPFLEGTLHLPDDRSFPDAWEPTEEGARRLADRILGYAGLEAHAHVEGFTNDKEHALDERGRSRATQHEGAAAWYAGTDHRAQRCYFGVDVEGLRDPSSVVGTMCHEVAHAYRDAHTLVREDHDEEERLTDLTTVYLGFGVLTATSSYVYRSGGVSGSSFTGTEWSHAQRGYLSVAELCFALAVQVKARGGREVRAVAAALAPTQRACFEAALTALGVRRRTLPPWASFALVLLAPIVLVAALVVHALLARVPACAEHADCGATARDRCRDGVCMHLCESASECAAGQRCVRHACE